MYNSIKDEYLSLKRALFDKCYASLNKKQREAVFTVNNPLLILAGAGSGKTTVLVKRIVYIMKYGNAYLSDYVPEFADESYIKDMRAALESNDTKMAENMLSDFDADKLHETIAKFHDTKDRLNNLKILI